MYTMIVRCRLYFLLIILLFNVWLTIESTVECLVSRNNKDLYYYPLNIFAPPDIFQQEKGNAVNCTSFDVFRGNIEYWCPNDRRNFCPLVINNLDYALHRLSDSSRTSLCMLQEKLLNPKASVRVIVTGGSVTAGAGAMGCCSSAECTVEGRDDWDAVPCRWANRFAEWMNATFPAHIDFHFIGFHGHTSAAMANFLSATMRLHNLNIFTENDFILLDHSVNDHHWATGVAHSIEQLIRRIYHYSKPYSFPTLLLLDADPSSSKSSKHPYYEAYERVARHYDIPVWSYRDSVLSDFARVNQSRFVNFTNFWWNANHGSHPGWPVHLYMADMYAGLLVSEMENRCDSSKPELREHIERQRKLHNRKFSELPSPLSANASHMCDKEYLSMSYDSVKYSLSPVGSYAFEPATGGWILGVDKEGRKGGFLVNASAPDQSVLTFTLNITTKELLAAGGELRLEFHFLRTYENAGSVRVSFCGLEPGSFDENVLNGLWVDAETHRFSLPDRIELTVPVGFCTKWKDAHPQMQLKYQNPADNPDRNSRRFKLLSVKACKD